MSPPPPPQPRATADLIPWRWRVTLVAMDGGAFVVSPLVGDIGWAWRMAHRRRAHAPLDKRRAITPPVALLLFDCCMSSTSTISWGTGDPYNHRCTPGLSPRREYYVPSADCCVSSKDRCSSFLLVHLIGLINRIGYFAPIKPFRCTSIQELNSSMEAIVTIFRRKFHHGESATCEWRCHA
jgi:hypothetical protein